MIHSAGPELLPTPEQNQTLCVQGAFQPRGIRRGFPELAAGELAGGQLHAAPHHGGGCPGLEIGGLSWGLERRQDLGRFGGCSELVRWVVGSGGVCVWFNFAGATGRD